MHRAASSSNTCFLTITLDVSRAVKGQECLSRPIVLLPPSIFNTPVIWFWRWCLACQPQLNLRPRIFPIPSFPEP